MSLRVREPPALSVVGVRKAFGPVVANKDVSFDVRRGDVHALLGQNGAGKSTLVSVICGRVTPDAGRVFVQDRPLEFGKPSDAIAKGVAAVFQELMLIPSMTGLENVALALRTAADRQLRERITETQKHFGLMASLDTRVGDLELGERQRLELIRALLQRPAVLLLDEPTSLLAPTEVEPFLEKIKELATEGIAILLITHRLDEARNVANHVTILREGEVVASLSRSSLPPNEELAQLIVGAPLTGLDVRPPPRKAETTLQVESLSVRDDAGHVVVDGVSLAVTSGEIVGIAGADGNGQHQLLEALAGLRSSSGLIKLRGRDVSRLMYRQRRGLGVYYISGDRRRFGIVPTLTIAQHFEYVPWADAFRDLASTLARYSVVPPLPQMRADQLSGGNQQKLILARACIASAKLLLLAYPTRGLDVQASTLVRRILQDQAKRGCAIVLASSDLDDLLTISHRIAVMSRGRIAGEQRQGEYEPAELASWFTITGVLNA